MQTAVLGFLQGFGWEVLDVALQVKVSPCGEHHEGVGRLI